MAKPRTPIQTKAARHLPLLRKTTSSVSKSKLETRTSRHLRMSHGLAGGRQIQRMDKRDWEDRMGEILSLLEHHRYNRNNALHFALSNVKALMADMDKKKAEMETYMEELQASNEEMRATNEEMRILQNEVERTHQDTEQILSWAPGAFQKPLLEMAAHARDLTDGDPPDGKTVEQLARLAAEAERMETAMSGLMDYWRVDVAGTPFDTVDCDGALDQALAHLKAPAEEVGAEISRDPLPEINGDRDQISLLFTILLKYGLSRPGDASPRLHVSATPMASEESPEDGDDPEKRWVFRLEDSHPEIPEADRKALFMLRPEGGEDAMNLATAWRIVNRHGGEIRVSPKAGGGNVFTFSLAGD